MIIGATKKLSHDVKVKFNSAVIKGDLNQVIACLAPLELDPKDRDNLAINGIEWSLRAWCNQKNLEVTNYLLSLPQTGKWFSERSRPIEMVSGKKIDFYPNEREEREEKFHNICSGILKYLKKLYLTESPLASEIINHLLQIAQDCHFEVPPEFHTYKRMSLSSVWTAFTALPGRVTSFLFSSSQSPSSSTQDLLSPKSPALDVSANDSDDNDSEYQSNSDDENDEDFQPDLDGSDSDYDSTDESDCDSELDEPLENDTENDSFDLAAYENWKKSEDMRKSTKREQAEKPSSSSDIDSDVTYSKRQRRT